MLQLQVFRVSMLVSLLLAANLCLAQLPPPTGNQCDGYSYSTTLTFGQTADKLLSVTFVAGGNNPCGFYSEVTFKNPGGTRTASGVSTSPMTYVPNSATASASMQMLLDDGDYSAEGRWTVEDDGVHPSRYYPAQGALASKSQSYHFNGYVQLTSTSWSPGSIHLNGNSTLGIQLLATNNCGGNVVVQSTLGSVPSGTSWNFNGATYPNTTTSASTGITGGFAGYVYLPLTISGGTTGTVQATTGLSQLPSGCDPRAPTAPASATANLSVTN